MGGRRRPGNGIDARHLRQRLGQAPRFRPFRPRPGCPWPAAAGPHAALCDQFSDCAVSLSPSTAAGWNLLGRVFPRSRTPERRRPSVDAGSAGTHCGSHINSLGEARACVPPPVRERFEGLVQDCVRCLCSSGTEDPIQMVRTFQEAQLLVPSHGVLPHLEENQLSRCCEPEELHRPLRERPGVTGADHRRAAPEHCRPPDL